MAHAQAKTFGFDKAMRLLTELKQNIEDSTENGLDGIGAYYQAEIKKGIRSQAPGGKRFKKLAKSTLRAKTLRGKTKNLALIDEGDMRGSVTWKRKHGRLFIGLLRQERHPRSKETMANLGAIHEFGSRKRKNQPPARPFIGPIADSKTIRRGAHRAFQKSFRRKLDQRLGRVGVRLSLKFTAPVARAG